MQTFLPYSSFQLSAQVLDKKRCWKQVVEAKQIIECLTDVTSKSHRYINHPAVQMWVGYEDLLKHYYNMFLLHCKKVHKINTTLHYQYCTFSNPEFIDGDGEILNFIKWEDYRYNANNYPFPFWLDNENFHRSHRARLIEKNREFYLPKFPEDENYNGGRYWWPVMQDKMFKII